ncbi:hypothetical protein I7I53_04039 [Histoplasma capsulatum var. duboisii H88]|uniref:Uncharacterized protein n=1 Tax=Ajellomyces capsulatus (strain H88) TaxID=544711 RepID=A0A8A1LVN2_AJEC8|nr:hypothetical protein I7I53_04039 [Histoplasma capsulatum var. duboisii H88]
MRININCHSKKALLSQFSHSSHAVSFVGLHPHPVCPWSVFILLSVDSAWMRMAMQRASPGSMACRGQVACRQVGRYEQVGFFISLTPYHNLTPNVCGRFIIVIPLGG